MPRQHDPMLIDELAKHYLHEQIRDGQPPRNPQAWLAGTREKLQRDLRPAYVELAVAGVRARSEGRKLTGWRHERGTHGISFVADPMGTDPPPRG